MNNKEFPYDVSVDAAARMIVIKGAGNATTSQTLELIARDRQTFRDNPGFGVMYDSVELTIDSSATDMVQVANALFAIGSETFGRFAVVVPEKRLQLGMMFTALAQSHGINASVFTQAADARRWLGVDV